MGETGGPGLRRADVLGIVALVAVALGSAAAGFVLATRLGGRGGEGGAAPVAAPAATSARVEPEEPPSEAAVPAAMTAPVTLDEPRYSRCWSSAEADPVQGEACGRLAPLERAVASRLEVARRCRDESSRPIATGALSLAVDASFGTGEVSVWGGPSSTLENAEEVVACLRRGLSDLSLEGMRHRFERYRLFFTYRFGEQEVAAAGPEAAPPTVPIVLDRVRLREAPESGRVLARLSRGEAVTLLGRREGWVEVRTADGRQGWVYEPAITGGE